MKTIAFVREKWGECYIQDSKGSTIGTLQGSLVGYTPTSITIRKNSGALVFYVMTDAGKLNIVRSYKG